MYRVRQLKNVNFLKKTSAPQRKSWGCTLEIIQAYDRPVLFPDKNSTILWEVLGRGILLPRPISFCTAKLKYIHRQMHRQRKFWPRAPAGMGKRGHLPPPPPGNVVKCLCALVVTAKRSTDAQIYALFSHCVVGFSTPTGAPSLDPAEGLSFPHP